MFNIYFCWWMYSNCRPLESEATALPTEPPPLPNWLDIIIRLFQTSPFKLTQIGLITADSNNLQIWTEGEKVPKWTINTLIIPNTLVVKNLFNPFKKWCGVPSADTVGRAHNLAVKIWLSLMFTYNNFLIIWLSTNTLAECGPYQKGPT